MKRITFSCLAAVILLQLFPSTETHGTSRNQKKRQSHRDKADTISAIHSAIRPGKAAFPGQIFQPEKRRRRR